jgi:hypothetical protein
LSTYEGQRLIAWYDHYLQGQTPVSTRPNFAS